MFRDELNMLYFAVASLPAERGLQTLILLITHISCDVGKRGDEKRTGPKYKDYSVKVHRGTARMVWALGSFSRGFPC